MTVNPLFGFTKTQQGKLGNFLIFFQSSNINWCVIRVRESVFCFDESTAHKCTISKCLDFDKSLNVFIKCICHLTILFSIFRLPCGLKGGRKPLLDFVGVRLARNYLLLKKMNPLLLCSYQQWIFPFLDES